MAALGWALVGTGVARDAAGEPAVRPGATWHGSVGMGGFAALTGPSETGLWAGAELAPGGALGRLGFRAEARTLDESDSGTRRLLWSGGLTYLAAAAYPRLALSLHGEAGVVTPDAHAAVGGGVETQLAVVGPLAVAIDSTATVVLAGVDGTDLILAGTVSVRLAR